MRGQISQIGGDDEGIARIGSMELAINSVHPPLLGREGEREGVVGLGVGSGYASNYSSSYKITNAMYNTGTIHVLGQRSLILIHQAKFYAGLLSRIPLTVIV